MSKISGTLHADSRRLRVLTVPGRGKGVEVERRRGRHDDAASRRGARLVRKRINLHDRLVCSYAPVLRVRMSRGQSRRKWSCSLT